MAQKPSISSTQTIPNLIQGVSQQATQQRRDAQAEAQYDCFNSAADGCVARPHFDVVRVYPGKDLTGSLFSEATYENESYLTGVDGTGAPFAFDLATGNPSTVTNEAPDLSYLTAGSGAPKDRLRAQVVDDYTFISNREVTVEMDTTTSPALPNDALVFIRASSFNTTYTINLHFGGTTTSAAYTTHPTDVIPTSTIANALAGYIDGVAGYRCARLGSTLHIYRNDGADFGIFSEDGNGDDYMRVFKGVCTTFERLPARAPEGFTIKVGGEQRTGNDDYYVRFSGMPVSGVWQETVGPNLKTNLKSSTMPHALVLTGANTFAFRRMSWSSRVAGDDVTAKVPEFVGKAIRDLTYYNRRLGVIHRGGTVFSKTDAPFTFFRDTVQTVLATDPIDTKAVGGSKKKGSPVLDFAVLVAESIFTWAQKTQFRLDSGQEPFKQDTVETKTASAYEYSPGAYPLDLAAFLFMPTDVGEWASLRAILFQNGKVAGDVDVSSHVTQYIPSGVRLLTGSDTLRCVYIQSDGAVDELVLFNYTWDGQQFIQSAFNKWRLPGGQILWASVDQNVLRLVQQRPEGVALLEANLTPRAVDNVIGAKYMTRLDLRVSEAAVTGLTYNSTTGNTTFTLPYTPTGPSLHVVLSEDNATFTRGREFELVSVVGPVVTVKGDLTGSSFYVGQRIRAERLESEFFIRGDKGPEPTDRLTINRVKLEVSNTGYTRIEVKSDTSPDAKAYEFKPRVLGTSTSTMGTPKLQTESLDAPVNNISTEVSIRLINDSFLPSSWQSLAYDFDAVGWKGAK